MAVNDLLTSSTGGDLLRIQKLLSETVEAYRSGLFSTREELLQAYIQAINLFQATKEGNLYEFIPVLADTEPTQQEYNNIISGVKKDLELLFLEMNSLALLATGTFNQTVSEQDDLIGRIKRVSSKLADYELIIGSGGISIGESFSTTENLSIGSELITTEECEVVTNEGAITSSEKEAEAVEISSITIDSNNTNGVIGSNEDISVNEAHNNVSEVLDGNPDTWVEFEKTFFTDQTIEPLNVRLIFKLSSQTIVNRLEIDPVNFGLLDSVLITDIRVSGDGANWTSIVDDIPLATYSDETTEAVYILSPASSKFTGKFTYSFLPRQISHMAIDFQQNSGYQIETTSGTKTRVAIGIKSIDLTSIKYSNNAQLVSGTLTTSENIAKMALLSAYRPTSSSLASVIFSVSFDGGTNWIGVQPLESDDLTSEEVLTLSTPTNNFIYKIELQRNDDAFSDIDTFSEQSDTTAIFYEQKKLSPDVSPVSFNPIKQLISDDVTVTNSPIGARGLTGPGRPRFNLATGTGDALNVLLPFDLKPDGTIPVSDVDIFVSGIKWTNVHDQTALDASTPEARVYFINSDNEVVFGDGDATIPIGAGRSPAAGASIHAALAPESLFFYPTEGGYLAATDLASGGNNASTLLQRVGQLSDSVTEVLTSYTDDALLLSNRNIDSNSFSIKEVDSSGMESPLVFVTEKSNRSQLATLGDYYVDYKRGAVYSYLSAISTVNTTTVTYRYYPLYLNIEDYDWQRDSNNTFSGIFIATGDFVADSWTDLTGDDKQTYGFDGADNSGQPIVSGKIISLSQPNVIKGTLVLEDGIFGTGIKPVEVEFQDGSRELRGVFSVTEEELEQISSGSDFTHSFTLIGGTNVDSIYGVHFSDTTIFSSQKTTVGGVVLVGDYHIDFSTGLVTVRLAASGITAGVTASYYVSGNSDTTGYYSVNYEKGKVFCSETVQSGYKASYSYSKYRIHYPVARTLDTDEYEIDVTNNTITIKTEKLHSGDIAVAYEYNIGTTTSLSEIVEHYTPLVRDVRWRILTEGMII